MNIDEKAETSPDIDLARQSAPGAYVLRSRELESADDLTDEDKFPEYGDFLPVWKAKQGGNGSIEKGAERFIECPADLARWLVENELQIDDSFRVVANRKIDGEWEYTCEVLNKNDD